MQQTRDGGYVVVGTSDSFGDGGADVYLIRIDAEGDQLSQRTFGGAGFDEGRAVQETADGGFILVGWTNSFGLERSDVYLVKVSAEGDLEWQQWFGTPGFDFGEAVQQTIDGGYIVTGWVLSEGEPDKVFLAKTDSEGAVEWQRTFSRGGLESRAYSVKQLEDGGYIVAGTAGVGTISRVLDVYLVRTWADGAIRWEATSGHPGHDWGRSVAVASDGGFVVAGCAGGFSPDMYLVKFRSDGTVEWDRVFGGTEKDQGFSVQETADGGFIIAGETLLAGWLGQDYPDAWLVKTNSTGTFEWHRTYGGLGNDAAACVQQTADGGYIVAGQTQSFDGLYGDPDVYVLKTGPSGDLVWEETYGVLMRAPSYVAELPDGGYVVGGASRDGLAVLKFDRSGALVGSGGGGLGLGRWVGVSWALATADGGFVATGSSSPLIPGTTEDLYLAKVDQDGDREWDVALGVPELMERGDVVRQTTDGGYIVAGRTSRPNSGCEGGDIWVLKFRPDGTLDWEHKDDIGCVLSQVTVTEVLTGGQSEGFLVAGRPRSGGISGFLLKLDPQGGVIWERDSAGIAHDVLVPRVGGFIFAGSTRINAFGADSGFWVARTDIQGNVVWDRLWSPPFSNGEGLAIQQTTDGGYIAGGWGISLPPPPRLGEGPYNVVRIDQDGQPLWWRGLGTRTRISAVRQTREGGYLVAGVSDPRAFVTKLAPDTVRFVRADANGDGVVDISDAISTLQHLFLTAALPRPLTCLDAADANDDGRLDVSDAIYTLGFLFLGSPAPPAPFPDPGLDLTADALGCSA